MTAPVAASEHPREPDARGAASQPSTHSSSPGSPGPPGAASPAAKTPPPSRELLRTEGHLWPHQARTFVCFPFDVPPGTGRLRIRFYFEPAKSGPYNNLLTLSLFDPHGFRGAGHRHAPAQEIVVDPAEATPGFLAGPVVAGRWLLEIDCHAVLDSPSQGVDYGLLVEAFDGPARVPAEPRILPARALEPARGVDGAPRWLKGDLHLHSQHSDGRWSMDELARYVERSRLDFLAVTDHNTISAAAEVVAALERAGLPAVVIPAMELTTFYGHANALGIEDWLDWRVRGPEGRPETIGAGEGAVPSRTMAQAAEEVRQRGGTFVVNHPRSAGYPLCTGCRWEFGDASAAYADALEVWNGEWDRPQNREALAIWDRWLSAGWRIPATAGTDAHGTPRHPEAMGYTYVWAAPDPRSILDAVRAGRSFLSRGPRLSWLEAIWEALPAGPGQLPATLDRLAVEVVGLQQPAILRLVHNGVAMAEQALDGDGRHAFARPPAPALAGWYRAELWRQGTAELLALANPVYAG